MDGLAVIHLLFAMVAYHLQADALGDLDAVTLRFLKRIGSARPDTEVAPLTDAFNQRRRGLLPGTVVTREWNGHIHRVMVTKTALPGKAAPTTVCQRSLAPSPG